MRRPFTHVFLFFYRVQPPETIDYFRFRDAWTASTIFGPISL